MVSWRGLADFIESRATPPAQAVFCARSGPADFARDAFGGGTQGIPSLPPKLWLKLHV